MCNAGVEIKRGGGLRGKQNTFKDDPYPWHRNSSATAAISSLQLGMYVCNVGAYIHRKRQPLLFFVTSCCSAWSGLVLPITRYRALGKPDEHRMMGASCSSEDLLCGTPSICI